jgi:hypothetical protein
MTVALMITATSDVTPLGKIHIATVGVKPDGSAWSHRDKTLISRFVLDPPPSSEESPWVLIARVAAAAARAEESE